jgi:hypothetical protein
MTGEVPDTLSCVSKDDYKRRRSGKMTNTVEENKMFSQEI